MKKRIVILATLFVSLAASTGYYLLKSPIRIQKKNPVVAPIHQKPCRTFDELKQYYTAWLRTKEKEMFQELRLAGCDFSKLAAAEIAIAKKEAAIKTAPIHPEIQRVITTALKEFGLDPQKIRIIDYQAFSASAGVSVIFVNQNSFKQLSPDCQKFLIAHEIMHIIHKDVALARVIYAAVDTHLLHKFLRFREIRADISAALHGEQWPNYYAEFAQQGYIQFGEKPGITHPKNSLRNEFAQHMAQFRFSPDKKPIIIA